MLSVSKVERAAVGFVHEEAGAYCVAELQSGRLDGRLYVDHSRHMDESKAASAFGALSQETRLQTFRLLVRCGTGGMAAGEIARTLGIPHNTLSSHLSILVNAGLVGSRREGRSMIYSIDFAGTRSLLSFLMEDCCQGRPEVCAPVLDSVLPGCCTPAAGR